MEIRDKVAIITGGASGIGAGLAERFATEGARGIVVADINLAQAEAVAQAINAAGGERAMALRCDVMALRCDVSAEADIQALAFAEWLRVAYGHRGVRVSCLCPQAVQSGMTSGGGGSAAVDGMLTPAQVAADVVAAMRDETFLVLPHPEVLDYFRRKGQDYDRWLGGMQKIYARQVLGQ